MTKTMSKTDNEAYEAITMSTIAFTARKLDIKDYEFEDSKRLCEKIKKRDDVAWDKLSTFLVASRRIHDLYDNMENSFSGKQYTYHFLSNKVNEARQNLMDYLHDLK